MCLPTKSDVRAVVDAFKSSLDAETIKKLSIGGKFVVDDNVYTKNQQFRLLYNSKMLHSTSLHPMLPLEKAFKLTEENIHTTICQVLKESEKFHPLIKPEGTVTKHIPENNKLRKFPVEDVLPPAVIERITHLTGNVRPVIASTYDNVKFRMLVGGFRKCLIKGGEHRNNNVFFVYDISTDVLEQACWDDECAKNKDPRPNIRHVHPDDFEEFEIFED